jgi:hypothetical protein
MESWSLADLLPGLWVALLGAGLAFVLRRWYDAVPGRVLAVFGVILVLLFGSALFGGGVLISVDNLRSLDPYRQLAPSDPSGQWIHGDLVFLISPWLKQMEDTLTAGRWPLWNDLAGAGMPMMGDPQVQTFQPFVVAAYPFSPWTGIGVTAALRVLAALVFTFLLMRRQGLGPGAALAGSFAFGLGGFLLLWLNWPMGNIAALLPLGLYAVVRCDENGGRRDFLLLGIAVAAMLLSGHPETMVYVVVMTGLFLLDRLRRRWWDEGRQTALRLLVRGGAAFAVAGLIVAPILLPVQDYLPKTRRAAVVSYHFNFEPGFAETWAEKRRSETLAIWRRWADLRTVPFVAPRALGTHRTAWWGETNLVEDGASFTGTVILLAALAGMAPVRGRRRYPQEWLCIAVFLGGLVLLLQPPGLLPLLGKLPVIGPTAIHRYHRLLVVMNFGLAYAAACQIERWRTGERRGFLLAVAALVAGGAVAWGYVAHPNPGNPSYLTELRYGWMAAQLAQIALAAGLVLLALRRPTGESRPAAAWLPWSLAAIAGVELLALNQPANPVNPRRLAYPVRPPIRFLMDHVEDTRIVGIGPAFRASLPAVYGLNDLRIDNPSVPDLYVYLTTPLARQTLVPSFARPRHPLYDLLGVRYVVTSPQRNLPYPRVFAHESGWIFERPTALPRLFLPARVQILREPNWFDWVSTNADFSRRALVTPSPGRDRRWRAERPRASTLAVHLPEPEHVRGEAKLAEPRLIASSVFQDGHWRLLVDGAVQPTVLANGPFVAAWVREGEHRIDLLYRPRPFILGCLLSALGWALAAALCVRPPGNRTGAQGAILSGDRIATPD